MSEDQYTRQDPTRQYGQQQGQPAQQQSAPGSEQQMGPKPDHGEQTYRGTGRLDGKRALITGGDSGIGRAVAIAYARDKAAIANFTKALALNLADQGIRVNAVAPGPVWTPLIPATMPEEKVKRFGTDVPMGRPGQPAELAPAYVFFASQESSYVTGEILGVTGGKLTR